MPSGRAHRYFTKLILGKPYDEVHEFIDKPYSVYGKEHRRFFHSCQDAFLAGFAASPNSGGGLAGLAHAWLDKECSKDRDFKKVVELAAKADRALSRLPRRRRRRRKG